MVDQIADIEFIATETEAEALLAEQNFIALPAALQRPAARRQVVPLHRDLARRGLPARLLHAREAPREPRLLRAVLEREARARDARPARQGLPVPHLRRAEPGRARGSPCLDYFIKRCGRRASATCRRRSTARTSTTIVDFLSGRYRQIERDLEAGMHAGRGRAGVRAGRPYRNRLKAVRSLLERQRISNEAVGTLDAIAVAAEGTDANAQVFQVRDGVLADRQSFYLENDARARRGRGGRGVRAPVLRHAAGDPAAG